MSGLRPDCPCGSGSPLDACCGRLLRGATRARTAEELMRSRYTAYAVGGTQGRDHLFRTWHPRTRPDRVEVTPDVRWTRLEVLETQRGGEDDQDGVVAFAAHHERTDVTGGAGVLRERSAFGRRAGHWVYVGEVGASSA